MRHRLFVWLQAFAICSTLMLTGCENGNLFGKLTDTGGSSDPQILISQGNDALHNGDYAKARELFEKALANDPDNALAMYGASIAAMGASGIDIGALVANLISQSSTSFGVQDMAGLIRRSRISVSAPYSAPHSIMDGVDLQDLDDVIDLVICRLEKIVSGATDGSIETDRVDVLVNFASICFIRSVLRPIRADFFDITNTNGTFDVTKINVPAFNAACDPGNTSGQATVLMIGKDVVAAWHLFNRAATVLNLNNDALIVKLRDDVARTVDLLLDPGSNPTTALPNACITLLDGMGINEATFTNPNATMVFTPNATPC